MRLADRWSVTGLLDNARRILETAVRCTEPGPGSEDWTVFVGPHGGLQMIAGSGHSLESLRWSQGAISAWRVSRSDGQVRVEGREGRHTCLLESPVGNGHIQRLLSDVRLYELAA